MTSATGMAGKLAGKRILVVEDEYFIASDLKRALVEQGAAIVGPVGRLNQGLSLVERESIDAAILDVNLDGTTTYPIADRLEAADIPWMFVTGYDDWALPDEYRDVPRIAKPFATRAVIETLVSLIGNTNKVP